MIKKKQPYYCSFFILSLYKMPQKLWLNFKYMYTISYCIILLLQLGNFKSYFVYSVIKDSFSFLYLHIYS